MASNRVPPQGSAPRSQAPTGAGARPSPALVVAEGAGEAAAHAVRAAPASPTGAAFGALEHLVGTGRRALGAARANGVAPAPVPAEARKRGRPRRPGAIARSLSQAGPALVVEPALYFTGLAKREPALVVSAEPEPRGPGRHRGQR